MSRVIKAHLALLGVNAIYGANFTIVKAVVPEHIQPFALVVIRATCSMLLFWLSSLFLPKEKIERKDYIKLLLLGVFGVALNQLLFIKGLAMSTPINGAIIMIFNPIIVMLLEVIFFKEKTPFIRVAGILVGITGALVLLLGRRDAATASASFTGDMLILVNCISWAIYMVMVKPLMLKYKTVTVVKWVFSFGAFYVLPFGWSQLQAFDFRSISLNSWMCIAYVVIASTYIAYYLNTYALAELSPSIASTYIYLQPVIAAAIAVYYGQDKINVMKVLSAIFIIVGIYLVGLSRKKEKQKLNAQISK
ncbi:MAG TPA: DMT family transporter [Bacteroidia bacterium]|jgi:drug/metabolite transporter (DMT)-like permease|nr:DMT family transporter [Bacteroidia bacterium]